MKKLLLLVFLVAVGFFCYRYSYVFGGLIGRDTTSAKLTKEIKKAEKALNRCRTNWQTIQDHKSYKETELTHKNAQYAELLRTTEKRKAEYKKDKSERAEKEYYECRKKSEEIEKTIALIKTNIKGDQELLDSIGSQISKLQELIERAQVNLKKVDAVEKFQESKQCILQINSICEEVNSVSATVDSVINNVEVENAGRFATDREKYGKELE